MNNKINILFNLNNFNVVNRVKDFTNPNPYLKIGHIEEFEPNNNEVFFAISKNDKIYPLNLIQILEAVEKTCLAQDKSNFLNDMEY